MRKQRGRWLICAARLRTVSTREDNCLLDRVRPLGHTADFGHLADILQNIRQTRWLKIHDHWRSGQCRRQTSHCSISDCADVAQFLSENEVGPQLPQKGLVDCVNGAVLAQSAPDPGVHFVARKAGVMDRAMGHSGSVVRRSREIAFMRHAHDLLHQSKGRGDLGRGRQERDDALHRYGSVRPALSLEIDFAAFHHEAHLPNGS